MGTGTRHGLFPSEISVELGFLNVKMPWFCDNHGGIQSTRERWFPGKHETCRYSVEVRKGVYRGWFGRSQVGSKEIH